MPSRQKLAGVHNKLEKTKSWLLHMDVPLGANTTDALSFAMAPALYRICFHETATVVSALCPAPLQPAICKPPPLPVRRVSRTPFIHQWVRCILPGAPQYAIADALGFTATNEYPPVEHSKWPLVAEPFRSTTFTASSSIGDPDKDVFKWSFPDGTVWREGELKHGVW